MSQPRCCVLFLHHTSGAVVVIQGNAVQWLCWVVAESFDGQVCLVPSP